MTVSGSKGSQYRLDAKPFKSGGEGDVYHVVGSQPKLVAKIYKPGIATKEVAEKLTIMMNNQPSAQIISQVAWPLDIISDSNGFCGFVMPELSINAALSDIYKYPSQVNISSHQKIIIAENICAVISEVHRAGYVFGDFNPLNIGVEMNTGRVAFLDTDSYHVVDNIRNKTFRCNVVASGYCAPELLEKCANHIANNSADKSQAYAKTPLPTFTTETDNFALAIHIFKLLMNGYSPYGGIPDKASVSQASPGVGDSAVRRDSYCFKPGFKHQAVAIPSLDSFPAEIAKLFTRAFINGKSDPKQRPSAIEWHNALASYEKNLVTCAQNKLHHYDKSNPTCPLCAADARYSNAISPQNQVPSISQKTYSAIHTPPIHTPPIHTPVQPITRPPTNNNRGATQKAVGVRIGNPIKKLMSIKWRLNFNERIIGYPLLASIAGAIIYILLLSPNNFFASMNMVWVIDPHESMSGFQQSFQLPSYAAKALAGHSMYSFFDIAINYIRTIYMPFIVIGAGGVLSALVCRVSRIRRKSLFIMLYSCGVAAVLLYLVFNPSNFTLHNYMLYDISFFDRICAAFVPLALAGLAFTVVCTIDQMDSGRVHTFLIWLSIGYMLSMLVAAGIQNNFVGISSSDSSTRYLGYFKFPWFRFIIFGTIASFVAMVPSLLCLHMMPKLVSGTMGIPRFIRGLGSYNFSSAYNKPFGTTIGNTFTGCLGGGGIGLVSYGLSYLIFQNNWTAIFWFIGIVIGGIVGGIKNNGKILTTLGAVVFGIGGMLLGFALLGQFSNPSGGAFITLAGAVLGNIIGIVIGGLIFEGIDRLLRKFLSLKSIGKLCVLAIALSIVIGSFVYREKLFELLNLSQLEEIMRQILSVLID